MRCIVGLLVLWSAFWPLGQIALGQAPPAADLHLKDVFTVRSPIDSLGRLGSLFASRPVEPSVPWNVASLVERAQLRISAEVIQAFLQRPLDQRMAVNEVMLGVALTGQSRVTGTTRLQLVENPDYGAFDVLLTGTIVSKTVGDAGKAKIHTRTVTRFSAIKRIILNEQGLTALPARCRAKSASTLLGASSELPGLRGRLVRRISRKEALDRLPEAEAIAARRAEARLCRQFDQEADVQLALANKLLQQHVCELAAQSGRRTPFKFYTTHRHLGVAGLLTEPGKLRIPAAMQELQPKIAAVAVAPATSLDLTTAARLLGTIAGGPNERSWPQMAKRVLPSHVSRLLDEQDVFDNFDYSLRFAVDDGNLVVLLLNDD